MDGCQDVVFRSIIEYLTYKDMLSMGSTCKHIRRICEDDGIWKQLCGSKFLLLNCYSSSISLFSPSLLPPLILLSFLSSPLLSSPIFLYPLSSPLLLSPSSSLPFFSHFPYIVTEQSLTLSSLQLYSQDGNLYIFGKTNITSMCSSKRKLQKTKLVCL